MPIRLGTVPCVILPLFLIACDGSPDGDSVIANAARIVDSESPNAIIESVACSLGSPTTGCTPNNLTGRVFAMGAMLGADQSGGGYNLTFLGTEAVINDPSSAEHGEGEGIFDLAQELVVSGYVSIPDADAMPADPRIWRLETYFDFVDATFALPEPTLGGNHTIRTVFRKTATAGDMEGAAQVGDKLYSADGGVTFKWCTAGSCEHTTRPTSGVLQHAALVTSQGTAETGIQPGNPNYALYSVDFPDDHVVTVTHTEISDPTRLWTVRLDVTRAVTFAGTASPPSTTPQLVDAFQLGLACRQDSTCEEDTPRLRGALSIGAAGTAPAL